MMKYFILILFLSTNCFSKTINIAVLDTGIDLTNYPYKEKIKLTEKETQDFNGHGTHVSSIIIEKTKTTNYKIIPIKIFNYNKDESSLHESSPSKDYVIEKAVKIAKKHKVKIINISGGGNRYFEKDHKVIKKNPNILFIVASGNEVFNVDETDDEWRKYAKMKDLDYFLISDIAKKNPHKYGYYPCAYKADNVICVGNGRFEKDKFIIDSNFGQMTVDVFANGHSIESYALNGEKENLSGSSMATPQITAIALDILSENPKLKPNKIKEKVLEKLKFSDKVKEFSKSGRYLD